MQTIPRRQALRQLGLIAAGLAAACTPVRVLVSAYPQAFDDDDELVDRVLRAFVTAVIPGAPADDPDLVRAYTDPAYPFAQYVGFFAADLSRRAAQRFAGRPFERLDDTYEVEVYQRQRSDESWGWPGTGTATFTVSRSEPAGREAVLPQASLREQRSLHVKIIENIDELLSPGPKQ